MVRIEIFIYLVLCKIIFIFCQPPDHIDEETRKLQDKIKSLQTQKNNYKSSITDQETKLKIYSLYIFALICTVIILFILIVIIIIYEFIKNIKQEKNKSILLQSRNSLKNSQEIYTSKNSQSSRNFKNSKISQNSQNSKNIEYNENVNNNIIKSINSINENNNKNNYIKKEENINDEEEDKPRTESVFSKSSEKDCYDAPCIGAVIKEKAWTNDGEEHNLNNGKIVNGNPYIE